MIRLAAEKQGNLTGTLTTALGRRAEMTPRDGIREATSGESRRALRERVGRETSPSAVSNSGRVVDGARRRLPGNQPFDLIKLAMSQ